MSRRQRLALSYVALALLPFFMIGYLVRALWRLNCQAFRWTATETKHRWRQVRDLQREMRAP